LRNDPIQVTKLFSQIAEGIQRLHLDNNHHRNINVVKVLINQKRADGHIQIQNVKLTGYGFPKAVMNGYAAPELQQEPNVYTKAADIYSFGILLGEVVCCKSPRTKNDYSYELFKERGLEMFYELYEKCTKIEPSDRPDIHEVLLDLEKLNRRD